MIKTKAVVALLDLPTQTVFCAFTQLFLDAEKLVVFANAVCPAKGAGLDLPATRSHGDVGDRGVLRLARTMRKDGGVTVFVSQLNRFQRFGER